MSGIFIVRVAGVSALLAVVAQFAAIGIAIANGIQPGAPLDFSNGAQLLAAGDVTSGVLGLTLAPHLPVTGAAARPWAVCRARGRRGVYALFGATMDHVGMTLGLVHEVLRMDLLRRMPGLYQGATDAARLAVLALGDLIVHAQDLFALVSFVIVFGVGCTAFALGIIRTAALPRSLGWILLVLGGGVGLVADPLQYFRVPGASLVVLAAMMVFFLWLIAAGVTLLRWRPAFA